MQVLTLKKNIPDENGVMKETMVAVKVLRSFPNAGGTQIYLHTNGVYGYKDGSPVLSENELNVIPGGPQRQMAQHWWEATGKELSEKFYGDREAEERAKLGDFQENSGEANTELDYVLYRRRNVQGKKKGEWEEPFAWMEHFSRRPDWWGQAEAIVLPDFEYQKQTVADPAATAAKMKPSEV